jgi:hypothetical protein
MCPYDLREIGKCLLIPCDLPTHACQNRANMG